MNWSVLFLALIAFATVTMALIQVGAIIYAGRLARRAERVFTSLDGQGRGGARELFDRLVVPGDGGPDTRRRSRLSRLVWAGNGK